MTIHDQRSILVGFDGSPRGLDALALAKRIGRAEDADLILASVYEQSTLSNIDPDDAERLLEESRRIALAESEIGEWEMSFRSAAGSPAEHLKQMAATEHAEVLVIGSTHRAHFGDIYPGSLAERLLDGSTCAVAIAPRGYARREHVGLGIIGVGFDGSRESVLALRHAERIARRVGGELRLIAGVPDLKEWASLGYPDPVADHYADALEKGAALVEDVEVSTVLVDGYAAGALAEQGIELDLLVIGSRGQSPVKSAVFGSVSADVLHAAPCPVLVTPASSLETERRAVGAGQEARASD